MNTQTFGALVQTLRKTKAMTQEQLANKINVTSKAVSAESVFLIFARVFCFSTGQTGTNFVPA